LNKALIVLCISTCGIIAVSAQNVKETEVPSLVKAAFNKNYANTHAKWEKEKDNYEVNFKKDNKMMSAVIGKTGQIIETETDMPVDELPENVQSYLKAHYKGVKVKDAAKIVKANGEVNYEGEVNGKDVIFDKNGKFIKIARD
jgi:DNA polymerase II small subunit/DNA polymerase delta subunit B